MKRFHLEFLNYSNSIQFNFNEIKIKYVTFPDTFEVKFKQM